MSRKKQQNDLAINETESVVELALEGNLDECGIEGIRGWVINKNNPSELVKLDIFIDGELIAQASADIFRQDLLDAGIGNSHCAFHVRIPHKFFDNTEHKVELKETVSRLLIDGFSMSFMLTTSAITPEKRLHGCLDACDERGIKGWVIDEENPNKSVEIGVFIDGELIIQTKANIFRQDLIDNGIEDGRHGFHASMPNKFFDDTEHKVEIKDLLSELLLNGCSKSFMLSPTKKFKGQLDKCDEKGIIGWVMDNSNPKKPVKVDVFIDGELITQVTANIFRQDLLNAGIGNGKCTFNIPIPSKFYDGVKHKVKISETVTGWDLPQSPIFFQIISSVNNNLIQPIDQTTTLGCVEYTYPALIYGWIFSQNKEPLRLSVLVNNEEYFQQVDWFERHDIAEKYGDIALYSHFKITPSEPLKAAMCKDNLNPEDIVVLVNGQELPKVTEAPLDVHGLKLAVVVHAYYADQLELINSYLQNINCYFDLFITVPENVVEQLRPKIDALFFRRELRIVKNIGNDIAPFVALVTELDRKGYDLVCKIHTKRDHEQYKNYWRDCLLDGVVGTPSLVDEIIHAFKIDPQLHLVGPALTYTSARMTIYDAGDRLRSITSLLSNSTPQIDDWGFFAGTMFWARVSMFRPLQDLKLKNELVFSASVNDKKIDTAYLLERCFGLLPHIQDGKVGIVDYRTCNDSHSEYLRILNSPVVPKRALSKNISIFSLIKKGIWAKWSALTYYKFLDKRWYFIENPKIINPTADCLLNFLKANKKTKYLNEKHKENQIKIRFEKDTIYLDADDKFKNSIIDWPELFAAETFSSLDKTVLMQKANNDIKVSVVCITYNHEKYIKQALEGFVSQKTNFRFEVIIGDDASTDNTQEIIREYAEKFPDIFVPILRSENIGAVKNFLDVCSRIKGEFVAMNEGDDYWTDPNKLQIQANYLDKHQECTLCFHLVKVLNEITPKKNSIFPTDLAGEVFQLDDLVKGNFIQTNSVMYRWGFHNGLGNDYNVNAFPADLYLHSLHAALGEIHFIPKVMAVYRRHSGGVFSSFTDHIELVKKWGIAHIELFKTLDCKFNQQYTEIYLSNELTILRTLIREYLQTFDFSSLANLVLSYKETAQIIFNELKIAIHLEHIQDESDFRAVFKNNYKISVLVTSYNHAPYLSTCLDNILNQQGFFSLEVIVADDDSSDGTREIAEDYAARYPEIIQVLPKTDNMGMLKNMKRGFDACTSNFIAMCEGDDYWLSEMKLHKQLWMLISQPKLSMCFNWLLLYYEGKETFIPHPQQATISKDVLTFDDLVQEPLTANFSCCLYRAKTIRKIPKRYYDEERAADWLFNLCTTVSGDVGFVKETLSVYRIHEKGQWSGLSVSAMNKQMMETGLQFRSYFPDKALPDYFVSANAMLSGKINRQPNPLLSYHIQNIKIKYNCLFIDGWMINKESKSNEAENKTFIVTDLHNRIVSSQLMENLPRYDVDQALSANKPGRYLWAGFSTVFSGNSLQPNEYKLWIGLPSNANDFYSAPFRKLLVLSDGTIEVAALDN